MRSRSLSFLCVVLWASSTIATAQNNYRVTTLYPLEGFTEAYVTGIDAYGIVVGFSQRLGDQPESRATLWVNGVAYDVGPEGQEHSYLRGVVNGSAFGHARRPVGGLLGFVDVPFVFGEGQYRFFPFPEDDVHEAYFHAANERGVLVGNCIRRVSPEATEATLWLDQESSVYIDRPTGVQTASAFGINNHNVVVGVFNYAGSRTDRAFVWQADEGIARLLASLEGDDNTAAADINDQGQIVGRSWSALARSEAVLWEKDNVRALGFLPGSTGSARAYAINNHGTVVGNCSDGSYGQPFRWKEGEGMVNLSQRILNPGNYVFPLPTDINDAGQIVGRCYEQGTTITLGFLLTPAGRPTFDLHALGLLPEDIAINVLNGQLIHF